MKEYIYKDMSNSEIKLHIEKLKNEFDKKKNDLIKLCGDMDKIEKEYLEAQHEIEIRKNLYI
jgi:uncharacterized protein YeeX (DUF496 family)